MSALMSVEEYGIEMERRGRAEMEALRLARKSVGRLRPTGIACPECGGELQWNGESYSSGVGFGTPFSAGVECGCGLKGKICSFSHRFKKLRSGNAENAGGAA